MKRPSSTTLAAGFVAVVRALIVYSTLGLAQSLPVCVEYHGNDRRRSARVRRAEATKTAHENACAFRLRCYRQYRLQ